MATALYRRYRPDTFAEVIGQEHVTDPLRAALRSGRVGQAYLFSGPRGCGKTTSARILARCLNCAQGPTDTPCGVCDSCVELARGGSGSLDVVEIDAASHGGVDDARELRERATFAPARDRQKVFIIDEAHMVTPQGFNALLKIVEEPPPHIAFIFATTEPDKVLGTIRSRTHHYPFRLVPPQVLQGHLQQVCEAEGVSVGAGVLPLVVRAGAGSVRDSLSVLDQLAAGAGPDGIDYGSAVALLGYTHATLLDDVTAAFTAGDGAAVFEVVDRVISSGQDPRRFVDDLLQRLRDLVVVQAVGERAHAVFPGVPADQLERMAVQAAGFGAAQLSRAADLANSAANEMTGATSPRLHLELLCARMLLPAADDGERGLAARLDRVERRLAVPGQLVPVGEDGGTAAPARDAGPAVAASGELARGAQHVREAITRRRDVAEPASAPHEPVAAAAATSPSAPVVTPQVARPAAPPPWDTGDAPAATAAPAVAAPAAPAAPAWSDAPAEERPAQPPAAQPGTAAPRPAAEAPPAVVAAAPDPVGGVPTGAPGGVETTEAVRRMWPEVLDHLATVKRRTWTRVSQDAQVTHVDEQRLVLEFARPGTLQAFSTGPHADFVREALIAVLGLDRVVIAVNAGTPLPGLPGGAAPRPAQQRQEPAPVVQSQPSQAQPAQPEPARASVAAPPPRTEPDRQRPEPSRPDQASREPAAPQHVAQPEAAGPGRPQSPEPQPRDTQQRPQRSQSPARHAAAPLQQRSRRPGAAPPVWDDVPPPEPPDDGEPPPPEFDDPWTSEGAGRTPARPQVGVPAPATAPAGRGGGAPSRDGASGAGAAAAAPAVSVSAPAPASAAPAAASASAPSTHAPSAPAAPPVRQAPSGPLRGADLARSAVRARAAASAPDAAAAPGQRAADDEPSRDDPDAEGSGQVGLPVIQRVLGGRVLSIDQRS